MDFEKTLWMITYFLSKGKKDVTSYKAGQFIASSSSIRSRSLIFWQRLLNAIRGFLIIFHFCKRVLLIFYFLQIDFTYKINVIDYTYKINVKVQAKIWAVFLGTIWNDNARIFWILCCAQVTTSWLDAQILPTDGAWVPNLVWLIVYWKITFLPLSLIIFSLNLFT